MADRLHDLGFGEGVGDLGDHFVPGPDVGEAGWRGKGQDGVQERLGGPHSTPVPEMVKPTKASSGENPGDKDYGGQLI